MSVTREQVVEALRPVEDPELHRSIVDLGMLRDVQIDGGNVSILIALTVAGCPLRNEITNRVKGAVAPVVAKRSPGCLSRRIAAAPSIAG